MSFVWHEHQYDVPKDGHALLGGSNYAWVNYDEEKLYNYMVSIYAKTIGTLVHELAAKLIKNKLKVNKSEAKKMIMLHLLENGIPRSVIDVERYSENFAAYVNDAVGFDMRPEQKLVYSQNAWGTADAIAFNEKKGILRIHDFKNGVTQPSLHQLENYAAFFCLEYHILPKDISIELRIYWLNQIITGLPTAADIVPIMDETITKSKYIDTLKEG